MRVVAVVLMLLSCCALSACQGPKGDPGPAGPPGPTGLTGATGPKGDSMDIAALMARIEGLEKQLAAKKVPHLVVTATGEDLGVSLGGNCVIDDAGAEYCYEDNMPQALFSKSDCVGDAYRDGAITPTRASFNFTTKDGRLFRSAPCRKTISVVSFMQGGGCTNNQIPVQRDVVTCFAITGMIQKMHAVGDLAITL